MNYIVHSLKHSPLWEYSKYCFLDTAQLHKTANLFAKEDMEAHSWREDVFPEDDWAFLEFQGVANTINFKYLDFTTGKKFDAEYPEKSGVVWSGSMAMAASLKRVLDKKIPVLNHKYLAKLTYDKADLIFRPHTSSAPIPMLFERVRHLQDYGRTLLYNGEFKSMRDLFGKADFRLFNNGKGIVERIIEHFWCYDDRSRFEGANYCFYKRAQLLPMIYHGRALASGGKLTPIRDPQNFGAITDYAVPNALRHLGILKYCNELREQIDSGVEIDKGSRKEIEIRVVTVRIMHHLLDQINLFRWESGMPSVTMAELDYKIWSLGRKAPYKHHRTQTTAY